MKKIIFLFFVVSNFVYSQTTFDWQNTAPDGNWKQGAGGGARWNPGGLWDEPTGWGNLRFDNNHQLNMTNNVSGYTRHQVIFGSGNTSNRTIGGNSLRFFDNSGADPKIENLSTGNHTFNINIEGDGNDPLELNPVNGDLTFGTINNQGSDLFVFGNNSKFLNLTGVISGSGGLAIKQNSIVVMTAANTYSGQTTIENGELRINSGGSLANSDIRINNGRKLVINANTTVKSVAETGSGNSGTIELNSNAILIIQNTGTGTLFQNTISGNGGITYNSSGRTLSLFGNPTYTGKTTVTAGTLTLNNTNASSTEYELNGGTLRISGTSTIPSTSNFVVSHLEL